jgi:hypothetical protein
MANIARRTLISQSLLGAGAFVVGRSLAAFGSAGAGIEISLAEWSLHRALHGGKLDHLDFPAKAKKEFGISATDGQIHQLVYELYVLVDDEINIVEEATHTA